MCISLFCNCINYLPNQFTQIISNLRNWDEKPVQFFFHDLLKDFYSNIINKLIQIFLFRIQLLEVKCPKSVRCQQKHLWHTIGCNKENPSKRVTECNKRTREKFKAKIGDSVLLPQSRALEEAIWSSQLIGPLKDALKCLICQGICVSPIKASLCCKQFLGCESCVDNWDRPMCPHCRSEDYSTIEFTAFEAVLESLHRNVYTLKITNISL